MAWTSPRSTARLTSDSALTPGKVLVMERISRMWSLMDSVVLVLHAGWCGGSVLPAELRGTGWPSRRSAGDRSPRGAPAGPAADCRTGRDRVEQGQSDWPLATSSAVQ